MRARVLILTGVLWLAATPARADFIDLGNGLIYDTVQDLTWMQDVLYPRAAGLDDDGFQSRIWGDDAIYAFVDSISYAGSDDWRLPVYRGNGIWSGSDSEVSTVMRELGWRWETPSDGGSPQYRFRGVGPVPFLNMSAVFVRSETGEGLVMWSGFNDLDYAGNESVATWLVHDGKLDPAYSARVPEPSMALLLGMGLASFGLRKLRGRRPRA